MRDDTALLIERLSRRAAGQLALGALAGATLAIPASFAPSDAKKKRKKKPKPKGCGEAACFVRSWGREGSENGYFYYPTALAVSPQSGDVYVCDAFNHRIQQFSASGAYLGKWGSEGSGNGKFKKTYGIAVAPNDDVIVSDYENYRMQLFAEGTYLRQWGSFGPNPGQFNGWPTAVAVGANGNTFVTAVGGDDRVHHFDYHSGDFINSFGGTGNGNGQLKKPSGIAIAANGDLLVADSDNHRIQRFRADGEYRGQWGTFGTGNGQFNEPVGLTVAADGTIFVADSKNHRIQRFTADGAFLGQWGSQGSGNGQFQTPWDIAVHDNQAYVSELYNHRVQQFTLAAPPTKKRKKKKKGKKR